MNAIQIRRIYAAPAPEDGYRILVDRLWPRGVSRAENRFDLWARDVAPSAELRKSFAHQAERFPAFARAYRAELDGSPAAADFVRACGEILHVSPGHAAVRGKGRARKQRGGPVRVDAAAAGGGSLRDRKDAGIPREPKKPVCMFCIQAFLNRSAACRALRPKPIREFFPAVS
jgi:uncharacterized protein YeaO (DUF488 family)